MLNVFHAALAMDNPASHPPAGYPGTLGNSPDGIGHREKQVTVFLLKSHGAPCLDVSP